MLTVGLVAVSAMCLAAPAFAKVDITGARITGPGLDAPLRIGPAESEGLWDSGIDAEGGLDDARADSVERLGVGAADLGSKYLVSYFGARTDSGDLVRQELYPYAPGGPITYTPPGQDVAGGLELVINSGWYQSPVSFFRYLVEHGLPKEDPEPAVVRRGAAPDAVPVDTTPWSTAAVVVLGVMAVLALSGLFLRRRSALGR